jgi:uncharacterized membrane protein YgcG
MSRPRPRLFPCLPAATLALLMLLTALAAPVRAMEERIVSFASRIAVRPDGSLSVRETIRVAALGAHIRHGIRRDFPTDYRDRAGNVLRVGFALKEVLRDGRPEDYRVEEAENGRRVFVGKKDVLLTPGVYTYTLTYETDRQIGFGRDFDELTWNVTGSGWEFDIDHAEASVILPRGAEPLNTRAYTGPYGTRPEESGGSDYEERADAEGNPVFFTTRWLAPGEGLTVSVSWPKGFVAEPTGAQEMGRMLSDNPGAGIALLGLALVLAYYLWAWLRVGRDPAAGPVVPLFSPPDNLSPAACRFVARMGFDQKALAAAVVDMAVKGFLAIEEQGGGYALKRTGQARAALSRDEDALAAALLPGGAKELALIQANHARLASAVAELKKNLGREFLRSYFLRNRGWLAVGVGLSLAALAAVAAAARTPDQGLPAVFGALWLTVWSSGCYFLALRLARSWRVAAAPGPRRLRHTLGAVALTLFCLPFFGGLAAGAVLLAAGAGALSASALAALGLTNALFAHLLKAPTTTGRRAMDRIAGFRLYLSVAERERLAALLPEGTPLPEKTPELFARFLPYAVALDVEEAWAVGLSEALERAQRERLDHGAWASWYAGSLSGTSAADFSAGLARGLTAAISSAQAAPGSSTGGFSSGGGFSGGGGGGGGGGGW